MGKMAELQSHIDALRNELKPLQQQVDAIEAQIESLRSEQHKLTSQYRFCNDFEGDTFYYYTHTQDYKSALWLLNHQVTNARQIVPYRQVSATRYEVDWKGRVRSMWIEENPFCESPAQGAGDTVEG